MASKVEDFREAEIKRIGGATQRAGEALLEKHFAEPFVETVDPKTGQYTAYRKSVADRLIWKGKRERGGKKVFSVPDMPWKREQNIESEGE